MLRTLLLLATLSVGVESADGAQPPPAPTAGSKIGNKAAPTIGRHFDRVLTIVLENQSYEDVIADPYFAALARRGASLADMHARSHPSYGNYLAMVAGRPIPTEGNQQLDLNVDSIATLLEAHHLTWKNYAEGYPGQPGKCFLEPRRGQYARKHVPFLSFRAVQKQGCMGVVPGQQFAIDLRQHQLPNYALYIPDLDNDGHDPSDDPPVGLAKASRWLRGFLEPLLAHADFGRDTLIIVTFDESGENSPSNHIYTVLLGDRVRHGDVAGRFDHFSILRTIESNFGLPTLAREGDGNAEPVDGIWR